MTPTQQNNYLLHWRASHLPDCPSFLGFPTRPRHNFQTVVLSSLLPSLKTKICFRLSIFLRFRVRGYTSHESSALRRFPQRLFAGHLAVAVCNHVGNARRHAYTGDPERIGGRERLIRHQVYRYVAGQCPILFRSQSIVSHVVINGHAVKVRFGICAIMQIRVSGRGLCDLRQNIIAEDV